MRTVLETKHRARLEISMILALTLVDNKMANNLIMVNAADKMASRSAPSFLVRLSLDVTAKVGK